MKYNMKLHQKRDKVSSITFNEIYEKRITKNHSDYMLVVKKVSYLVEV